VKLLSKLAICFFIISALFSCKDDDGFSKIPEIDSREFTRVNDTSAIWKIGFKDGDGDIGVEDGGEENFIIQVYSIENNIESPVPSQNYRIPKIDGVVTDKGIEGEIELRITGFDVYKLDDFGNLDSIYYTGYLIDRKDNRSNIIATPKFKI
jgi:hypothetical protein